MFDLREIYEEINAPYKCILLFFILAESSSGCLTLVWHYR